MKKFFLFVMLFVSLTLSAEDVIVLKNSTRLDAKILEVSDNEIKYRKANNPKGPIFVLRVSEISAIIYENGDVQSFSESLTDKRSSDERNNGSRADNRETVKKSNNKFTFNPTPSDNYWFAFTLGYVMRNNQISNQSLKEKRSFLLDRVNHSSPAVQFGMTMNPTFKYGIGVRSGIFMEYTRETHVGEFNGFLEWEYGDAEIAANDITLSVPLQLSYRLEVIKDLSLMFYTGPVFDFGAFQNVQVKGFVEGKDNVKDATKNLYGGNYYDKYIGFNCLWGVGAAVQWKLLRLDIGGDFGIQNKGTDLGIDDQLNVNWNKPFYITLSVFL